MNNKIVAIGVTPDFKVKFLTEEFPGHRFALIVILHDTFDMRLAAAQMADKVATMPEQEVKLPGGPMVGDIDLGELKRKVDYLCRITLA